MPVMDCFGYCFLERSVIARKTILMYSMFGVISPVLIHRYRSSGCYAAVKMRVFTVYALTIGLGQLCIIFMIQS